MKKQQNLILIIVIGILVVGALSFYGGMQFGKSINKFSPRDFGQFNGQAIKQSNNAISSGEIISIDDKSITVKMRNNGSKIIFISDSALITKIIDGLFADLVIGQQVMVTGTDNSDGSITAKSIQIRPAGAFNAEVPIENLPSMAN